MSFQGVLFIIVLGKISPQTFLSLQACFAFDLFSNVSSFKTTYLQDCVFLLTTCAPQLTRFYKKNLQLLQGIGNKQLWFYSYFILLPIKTEIWAFKGIINSMTIRGQSQKKKYMYVYTSVYMMTHTQTCAFSNMYSSSHIVSSHTFTHAYPSIF